MTFAVPLPPDTGDEVADLAAFAAWEEARERHYYPARFGPDGVRLPTPRKFTYYLGVPEPSWLGKLDTDENGAYLCSGIPKFVSAARLARYRSDAERWPVSSACTYAIDSGAYIALTGTNRDVPWFADPDEYGGMILRFMSNNGYPPDFCAPQDWPCEPSVRAKTGFSVREHQELTLDAYLWMAREFPMVPWIPVLQGWEPGDHLEHAKMYADAGVDLAAARRVGVGSICRLGQLDGIVERIAALEELAAAGMRLHGFGIKTSALPLIGHLLRSADSMAWSFDARYSRIRLPECTHAGSNCANCYRYAVRWRERVLATLRAPTKETAVASSTRTDKRLAMRFPAELRTGDVFVHPERGRLTFVASDVASSARPTVAKISVQEGDPFETDAFHGPKFEIVSRGSVDPIFAGARKGTAHLYVPLTTDRDRCGECGDTNTPNHVPTIGGPGSDVPIDFSPLLDPPPEPEETAVQPGTVVRCPRCAKRARVRRDGKIGRHGSHNCGMVDQVPPHDVTVLSAPDTEPEPDLFTGLAAFGAMVAKDLNLAAPPAVPRTVALVDVEWGMYGEVKGYGPTGSRCTKRGYITELPRITTRGFSGDGPKKRSRRGDRLLDFMLDEPPLAGQRGGVSTGMYAEEDATFTVLEAPADRPLTVPKSLSRRMPVPDLRRGDVIYIWDEAGRDGDGDQRPRYHVQAEPRTADGLWYDVDVLVDGRSDTRTYSRGVWADIEDPTKVPWQAASQQVVDSATLGAVTERRAGKLGVPTDGHGPTLAEGDQVLGVIEGLLIARQVRTDFAGTVQSVTPIEGRGEMSYRGGEVPWVTVTLTDGSDWEFPASTWFCIRKAPAKPVPLFDLNAFGPAVDAALAAAQ